MDFSKDNNIANSGFCKVYDYTTTLESYSTETALPEQHHSVVGSAVNEKGEVTRSEDVSWSSGGKVGAAYSRSINGGINVSFWLPTEIDIQIELLIQPNLIKTKKQWSLERYKSGFLLTHSGKNPSSSMKTFETEMVGTGRFVCTPTGKQEIMKEEYKNQKMDFIPSGWTW